MTTDTETRADAYLAEVRRHLGALTDDERDDLLDDLIAHVHQVAADDERPLEESLGPPEAFAAELLASAGLTAEMPAPRRGLIARARGGTDAAVEAIRRQPAGRAVLDFLPELQPAWWLVRGWLLVYLLTTWSNSDFTSSFPFPEVLGSWVLGGMAVAVGAILSVRLGRRQTRTRWIWVVNAAAILSAVFLAGELNDGRTIYIDETDAGGDVYIDQAYIPEPGLQHSDGSSISNVYAYDASGQPLDRVRLYDQDGRPIEVYPGYDVNGQALSVEPVIGADGQKVTNVYPQHQSTTPRFPGDPAGGIAVPPPVVGVAPLPAGGTVTSSTTVPPPDASTPTTVPVP
jgi:HAAS